MAGSGSVSERHWPRVASFRAFYSRLAHAIHGRSRSQLSRCYLQRSWLATSLRDERRLAFTRSDTDLPGRHGSEKQREIASKGGRAAHQKGTAHEWTSEEARSAGRKGGQISRGGRGRLIEPPMESSGQPGGAIADEGMLERQQ